MNSSIIQLCELQTTQPHLCGLDFKRYKLLRQKAAFQLKTLLTNLCTDTPQRIVRPVGNFKPDTQTNDTLSFASLHSIQRQPLLHTHTHARTHTVGRCGVSGRVSGVGPVPKYRESSIHGPLSSLQGSCKTTTDLLCPEKKKAQMPYTQNMHSS